MGDREGGSVSDRVLRYVWVWIRSTNTISHPTDQPLFSYGLCIIHIICNGYEARQDQCEDVAVSKSRECSSVLGNV